MKKTAMIFAAAIMSASAAFAQTEEAGFLAHHFFYGYEAVYQGTVEYELSSRG